MASPGVVLRAANQNHPLASGKRTIIYSCRRRKAVTEEECGRKCWIIASFQALSGTLDFAVPLPTSLTLGHLLPGRRFAAHGNESTNSNLFCCFHQLLEQLDM